MSKKVKRNLGIASMIIAVVVIFFQCKALEESGVTELATSAVAATTGVDICTSLEQCNPMNWFADGKDIIADNLDAIKDSDALASFKKLQKVALRDIEIVGDSEKKKELELKFALRFGVGFPTERFADKDITLDASLVEAFIPTEHTNAATSVLKGNIGEKIQTFLDLIKAKLTDGSGIEKTAIVAKVRTVTINGEPREMLEVVAMAKYFLLENSFKISYLGMRTINPALGKIEKGVTYGFYLSNKKVPALSFPFDGDKGTALNKLTAEFIGYNDVELGLISGTVGKTNNAKTHASRAADPLAAATTTPEGGVMIYSDVGPFITWSNPDTGKFVLPAFVGQAGLATATTAVASPYTAGLAFNLVNAEAEPSWQGTLGFAFPDYKEGAAAVDESAAAKGKKDAIKAIGGALKDTVLSIFEAKEELAKGGLEHLDDYATIAGIDINIDPYPDCDSSQYIVAENDPTTPERFLCKLSCASFKSSTVLTAEGASDFKAMVENFGEPKTTCVEPCNYTQVTDANGACVLNETDYLEVDSNTYPTCTNTDEALQDSNGDWACAACSDGKTKNADGIGCECAAGEEWFVITEGAEKGRGKCVTTCSDRTLEQNADGSGCQGAAPVCFNREDRLRDLNPDDSSCNEEPKLGSTDAPVETIVEAVATEAFNLSCESKTGLVKDQREFANAAAKGWRVEGFADVLDDDFEALFVTDRLGNSVADTGRLSDSDTLVQRGKRYCYLSTGTGSVDKMQSAIWQKVKVPELAMREGATQVSLEVAYNFVSQEAPAYVGAAYNDLFFMKFDEEPTYFVKENVNDNASKWKTYCKSPGSIADSKEALPPTHKFSKGTCADAAKKVFVSQIGPRTQTIDVTKWAGKTMTLRFGVTDVGDAVLDSAVLIEHVQFVLK